MATATLKEFSAALFTHAGHGDETKGIAKLFLRESSGDRVVVQDVRSLIGKLLVAYVDYCESGLSLETYFINSFCADCQKRNDCEYLAELLQNNA